MKKAKKFMATLTAVTVSAISLCSLFTANADSEMMKTYRVFHNVNSADNITYIDYVMNYSSSIIANPSNKTPLLNNGYFVSSNNDKIQGTYLEVQFKAESQLQLISIRLIQFQTFSMKFHTVRP